MSVGYERKTDRRYVGSVVYVAQRDGQVLYVGQTHRDIRERIHEHRQFEWWGDDVTYVVHPCRTTAEALVLEARLVAELDPPHNVNLSPTNRRSGRLPHGAAQVAIVHALRAAGRPLTSNELRRATSRSCVVRRDVFRPGLIAAAARAARRSPGHSRPASTPGRGATSVSGGRSA